jgi:endonuclease IV
MFGYHVNRDFVPKRRNGDRILITEHINASVFSAQSVGFNMTAAAIFVAGPQFRRMLLTEEEISLMQQESMKHNFPVVIAHNIYTANPWKGNELSIAFIKEQALVCKRAGIAGLVVHLPKLPIDVVMQHLPKLICDVRIYLETPAVKSSESYYETPEKITELFRQIRTVDPELNHFGLCIDTAHLWTCGQDLSSREAAEDWLSRLDRDVIPPDYTMFHLNDSERPRGVGPDSHAALTNGHIWREYNAQAIDRKPYAESGLAVFIEYAARNNCVVILERKPYELVLQDYNIIQQILKL